MATHGESQEKNRHGSRVGRRSVPEILPKEGLIARGKPELLQGQMLACHLLAPSPWPPARRSLEGTLSLLSDICQCRINRKTHGNKFKDHSKYRKRYTYVMQEYVCSLATRYTTRSAPWSASPYTFEVVVSVNDILRHWLPLSCVTSNLAMGTEATKTAVADASMCNYRRPLFRCHLFPIPAHKSSETDPGPSWFHTATKTHPQKTWPQGRTPPPSTRNTHLPLTRGSKQQKESLAHQPSRWLVFFSKHNLSSFCSVFMVCTPEKEKETVRLLCTCVFRGFIPLAVSNLCYISLLFSFL